MGDPRRFDVFAAYVARQWPDRTLRIADVAGGKGGLQAALRRLGYREVVTIDKRRKCAHPDRPMYRYAYWTPEMAAGFDLVLGLHPDGATQAIARCPRFAVVPCCSDGAHRGEYSEWVRYVERLAGPHVVDELPMRGRSLVIRSCP